MVKEQEEDELAILFNNVCHSMEMLVHPLKSMVGTLKAWSGRLEQGRQEWQEVQRLEAKLQTILAIVAEIAGKKPRNQTQADD